MPMVAAPVAAWAMAAGASATVGAVAGAVAVGVVSGAVVGAATAAIKGDNIFKGALKGAAYGGITAGVVSGLGIATGFMSAGSQLGAMGVEGYGATAAGVESVSPVADVAKSGILSSNVPVSASPQAISSTAQTVPGAVAKPFMSDSTAKIVAGIGEGAAKGLGSMAASESEAESERELAEWQAQQKKLNMPGEFQARIAKIKVPEFWNRYLNTQQGVQNA